MFGEHCYSQQCQAASQCSQSCIGCCDSSGACQPGFIDTQCGGSGASCVDCTKKMPAVKCDSKAQPPGCGQQPVSCPGTYAGCAAGSTITPTTAAKACSSNDLQNASAACANGWDSTACYNFFSYEQTQNFSCSQCLSQFWFGQTYLFTWSFGVDACLQPFLDPTCNHAAHCSDDCLNNACQGCYTSAEEAQCFTTASAAAGVCSTYSQAAACTSSALAGAGAVCNPSTYQNNYGAWLGAVGKAFCGN
jgi:hypothetical protein